MKSMIILSNITEIKLETAMRLFETVVTPTTTYGIEITEEILTVNTRRSSKK
jgi:hypothetical protein